MEQQDVLRRLKLTFGDIPSLIRENVKYLSYNDEHDDFTCAPCDKIIQKSLSLISTTTNFENHLLSYSHVNNSIISTNILTQELLTTFFGEVPPIILLNIEKLSMDGENFKCVICDKIIQVSRNNITVTENNFSKHLLSLGHEKKLEDFDETLCQLYEIYGGISLTILNHSRFLKQSGRHYLCVICDKQLMVHPTDVKETERCFEQHLHSLKHIRNAKQTKAFSLIPELDKIFSSLPNYMLRSVEYISINGMHYFCSLCNRNIKYNRNDPYETELNFKLHIASPSHEEKLEGRKDPNNEVYKRLCSLYDAFPFCVQNNMKYLTVGEDNNDFYCELCNVTIEEHDDQELTQESLTLHFESVDHKYKLVTKKESISEVLQELGDVFGAIPTIIQDNLQHIRFVGNIDFECTLCNKILKAKFSGDYDENTSVTENNFQQHLESNGHEAQQDEMEEISDDIKNSLQGIFYRIPQYVLNNLDHLSSVDDSENFECILCEKVILTVQGSQKAELTEQNFRNHFLSVGHFAKLKHEANILMDATEKLELIFNKIPNCILSNIQHINMQENHCYCTLCDAKICVGGSESTEKQFRQHLFGSRHKYNLKDFENDNDEAFQRLDSSFWRVPEFMLRNIDFFQIYLNGEDGDDLFCLLCQKLLPLDEEDLEQTKQSLRNHIDSERHQLYLKSI